MQGDIILGALLLLTDFRFIKRCYEMKSNVSTESQCTYVYSHLREFEILRHLDGTVIQKKACMIKFENNKKI
jgi:hypothetical protein